MKIISLKKSLTFSIVLWAISVMAFAAEPQSTLLLASTTSTNDSGLFSYLLPKFEEQTHITVRPLINGTGQAIRTAQDCNADALLVHDKKSELAFMEQGYGDSRKEIMYNDFIIVGPKKNPAKITSSDSISSALKKIVDTKSKFISRGDDSGTNKAEVRLWIAAGISSRALAQPWYHSAGAGMGAVLNMASGMDAYTLSDRATWLSFKNRGNLTLIYEGDPPLFNQYSVITVNPAKCPKVNHAAATAFSDWLSSKAGQKIIGDFKIDGEVVFKPNYSESTK